MILKIDEANLLLSVKPGEYKWHGKPTRWDYEKPKIPEKVNYMPYYDPHARGYIVPINKHQVVFIDEDTYQMNEGKKGVIHHVR